MKLSSRKTQRGKRLELTLTSMIDVVFLLLIFFITMASIVKTEVDRDAAAGKKEEGASQAGAVEALRIQIRPDAALPGKYVYYITADNVFDNGNDLKSFLITYPQSYKLEPAIVQVDDDAPFEYPANAVELCKAAGFANVTIAPD